jgi:hypothetical protein
VPASTPQTLHKLNTAVECLENGTSMKGVTLRSPLHVTLEPGQDMTLTGKVSGLVKDSAASVMVLQRSPDVLDLV